jgi:hypothetical protein
MAVGVEHIVSLFAGTRLATQVRLLVACVSLTAPVAGYARCRTAGVCMTGVRVRA